MVHVFRFKLALLIASLLAARALPAEVASPPQELD
jgi:hypothetical protein